MVMVVAFRSVGYSAGDDEVVTAEVFICRGVVKRPSWPIRRKIALGMACGLAYLHYGAQLIKASNVLLDENFEPNKFWPCKVWSKGDDTSEHKVSSYGVVLLSGRKALLSKDKEKACLLTERAWS
ncbi:hypothetical protein RJ639_024209 [Escallonia herrerae]|uniref:Protein kinase domain-containing protein n=1 Tax=Escallonia herrerae TaxID=1293975 RepID=A0AA88UYJ5_9ASTE|nr:hypothetical protein RJ639_024209 [Escallonia herrerae]